MNPAIYQVHLRRAMLKQIIILLTFMAYSLTLVHSLVPHHHHDEADKIHSHDHNDHSQGNHHENEDEKSLSQFFADAIHHPSAKITIHSPQSGNIQNGKTIIWSYILTQEQILLPKQKPPGNNIAYQAVPYSANLFTRSLLRAPPAI